MMTKSIPRDKKNDYSAEIIGTRHEFIADKTNWRNMLKGNADPVDLKQRANELVPLISVIYDLKSQCSS